MNQKNITETENTHTGHLNRVCASVIWVWSGLLRCVGHSPLLSLTESWLCRAARAGWLWPAKANVKSPIMICPRCRPSSRKNYLSCLENNCCVTILYRASDVCQDQIGWQNGTKMGSFYKISSRKVSLTVNNPITPCALDDGENMKTWQSLWEI